jgi:hypothetical protein
MQTNQTPATDPNDNPTGCYPRFSPEGWDAQALHFEHKPFVRALTHSTNFVPQDMSEVFGATFGAIAASGAADERHPLVPSRDLSPSQAEHLFAVTQPVANAEMVALDGDYRTKVFEGPFERTGQWQAEFTRDLAAEGKPPETVYFSYPTCRKCSAAYGKNFVVGVAKVPN